MKKNEMTFKGKSNFISAKAFLPHINPSESWNSSFADEDSFSFALELSWDGCEIIHKKEYNKNSKKDKWNQSKIDEENWWECKT